MKPLQALRHTAPRRRDLRTGTLATAGGIALAALAATALVNRALARKAERNNPPQGRFLDLDGTRLHYIEQGEGEPLVLLHGNGSMVQDFVSSGLVRLAAQRHRVIVIDRPGFGYSERPRSRIWTPEAQADLVHAALGALDATPAVVLGHSWGASLALALALRHPEDVRALVLASGYYYPTVRPDFLALAGPAIPLAGDVLRLTLLPLLSRLLWPLITRKIFGPAPVPMKFRRGFPVGLAMRPSQLRASAAESALLLSEAVRRRNGYGTLAMPVAIVAGEMDRLIDIYHQSARLHRDIRQSSFHPIPGTGHMVHQTAPAAVMAAIEEASAAADTGKHPAAEPTAA